MSRGSLYMKRVIVYKDGGSEERGGSEGIKGAISGAVKHGLR